MDQSEFIVLVKHVQRLGALNQVQLAQKLGLSQSAVSRWFKGSVPELPQVKAVEGLAASLTNDRTKEEHGTEVTIRGLIGAGAEIDAGVEQPPAEGWGRVRTRLPLPPDSIAFEVVGESMQPRYFAGDVVICPAEGTPLSEIPDGAEAALKLTDGRRFLKFMVRSGDAGRYILTSPNASVPIVDAQVAWAAHILLTIRADQWSRLAPAERQAVQAKARIGRKLDLT